MDSWENTTVRGILIEMKNTSELAVYLAYSALMFRNQNIADEVAELEERIDDLNSNMRRAAMLSVRNPEDAEKLEPLLRISSAADSISNAASEIAELLQRGMKIHPIIFEALEMAEEKVVRCRIEQESKLAGVSLEDANLESRIGLMVIAIRMPRGKWIWGPEDETLIPVNGVIIARGPGDGAAILRQVAKGERELPELGVEED